MKILFFLILAGVGLLILAQGGKSENVLDTDTFKEELDKQSGVLLDVRTPKEYAEGHLKGAANMNFFDEDFKKKVAELDKGKVYFVYCRSGRRSANSAKIMGEAGLTVYDMAGGILAWQKKGLPVEK